MFRLIKRIFRKNSPSKTSREVFDILFNSPVGILDFHDPYGDRCNGLSDEGFSFVEIGPVCPSPARERFGFKSADEIAEHLRGKRSHRAFIAANICKNHDTDIESAAADYLHCFNILYDYVDMFIVNVADKSNPGTTQLQDSEYLSDIVDRLIEQRLYCNDFKPILIEISDSITRSDLDEIISYVRSSGLDGIVCGNHAQVEHIASETKGRLTVISKHDFHSAGEAMKHLDAGATLIECTAQIRANSIRRRVRRCLRSRAKARRRS